MVAYQKYTKLYLDYQQMSSLSVLLSMFCRFLQVKFSELTLDMFRMLQTLEREPQEDLTNQIYDASPAPGRQPFVSTCLAPRL